MKIIRALLIIAFIAFLVWIFYWALFAPKEDISQRIYKTIKEIEANYVWPSVDWLDFSVLPEQVKGHEHQVAAFWGTQPLRVLRELRGHEQAYMDLVVNPELAAYCIDKILEFGPGLAGIEMRDILHAPSLA